MKTIMQCEPVDYNGYKIKTYEFMEAGNWSFTVYSVTDGKWKNIRSRQGLKTENWALKTAKEYIDRLNPQKS